MIDAVLSDREITLGEIGDRLAVAIEHADVERHDGDAAAEGAGLAGRLLCVDGEDHAGTGQQRRDGGRDARVRPSFAAA